MTTNNNAAWFYWTAGFGTWGWYECSATAAAVWASMGVPVRLAHDLPASRK